jgi:hypothetical protein
MEYSNKEKSDEVRVLHALLVFRDPSSPLTISLLLSHPGRQPGAQAADPSEAGGQEGQGGPARRQPAEGQEVARIESGSSAAWCSLNLDACRFARALCSELLCEKDGSSEASKLSSCGAMSPPPSLVNAPLEDVSKDWMTALPPYMRHRLSRSPLVAA